MQEIKIFESNEFGKVRTIIRDKKMWFCLADVCRILEIENVSQLKTRLNLAGVISNEVGVQTGVKKEGVPAIQQVTMTFINESNLYKTIFQSRKPEAEKFTLWVTDEVLPTIRETGMYAAQDLLNNPDFIIDLATKLKETQAENKQLRLRNSNLTVDNALMKPKAEYFDELVDRNLLTSFRETAKLYGIKERVFINFLLEKKFVYRDKKGKLMPFADRNDGLFEIKETFNDKTAWRGTQTLITPKGRETFRLLRIC